MDRVVVHAVQHDLDAARKGARTDEDAAAIAWAEDEIERLRQALNIAHKWMGSRQPQAIVVAALEAAIALVGRVVTGEVTRDDSATGVLASYRLQFADALDALKKQK